MAASADNGWLLQIERHIGAKPDVVWHAMTKRQPEWWCPKPWTVEIIAQDWRAGGRSAMVMRGPDGEEMRQEGVFLEVVDGRRFVTTDAFRVGWVPQPAFMTGCWEVMPDGDGSLYRASARHWNATDMQRHEAMGFTNGWGICADQLAAMCTAAR